MKTVISEFEIKFPLKSLDHQEIEVPTTFEFRSAAVRGQRSTCRFVIFGSWDGENLESKKLKLILVKNGVPVDVNIVQLRYLTTINHFEMTPIHIWQDCR